MFRQHALRSTAARRYATASSGPQARATVPNYDLFKQRLDRARATVLENKPLTLAQKILYAHLHDVSSMTSAPVPGETYLKLSPDRVAMQDASAQMAILQFMLSGMKQTAVPTSIHCDHLVEAYEGADKDVARSWQTSREIYEFLQAASQKYGIAFWKPGSGIIHQLVLENYAAPGTLMLGTDSHTPNAGGLGMLAIGVGGADAVDAMASIPWELKAPRVLGVRLSGSLHPWGSPKDVILALAGKLTVRGGTGYIVEYFGEGVESLSCTGMATICNMGAEVGATTSVFPYTPSMARYLRATQRAPIATAADAQQASYLSADEQVTQSPETYYDEIVDIDLSSLEPGYNGPFTPDLYTPRSLMTDTVGREQWSDKVSAALIGSCTNSSYQDLSRAASLARQASERGLKVAEGTEFLVSPGSEQIRATMERDGIQQAFESIGAKVLANACGPCIGQWNRDENPVVKNRETNSIVSSFNRNFRARNDGNPNTMNFLTSPEMVLSAALSGRLSFNPLADTLTDSTGKEFKLQPPTGDELPKDGYAQGRDEYKPLLDHQPAMEIPIAPTSARLQTLEAFVPWNGQEFFNTRVLITVQGKCTTDHISAAGKWLKYKGHLENLSRNTLIGAANAAMDGQVNLVRNSIEGLEPAQGTIPDVALAYKTANVPWLVIADYNYGEGSAREHAAMQPRFLGCNMVIARSFARIHETNLKKQGVLPLVFARPDEDYFIFAKDPHELVVQTQGVKDINEHNPVVTLLVERIRDGNVIETYSVECRHTMSADQIGWFKAGSALNLIASQQGATAST
ncbi:aconitate hydratase [Coemansia aciculifera]|uniref:Aconitate hydratase, mitochondrial n=1 Tax=Coemansia aciculifera TaxID=417176 RepID=A0A9W8IN95_9FUNG|nr:aconitate hydratase [Coemansia aciculifera]KAJ2875567.1 aconitate hydratase [Coemansia aciculifera]